MLFNSIVFFQFLFAFLILYFFTRGTNRIIVSLVGSYLFYGWWDYRFLVLIFLLTMVNFLCALRIHEAQSYNNKKLHLIFSIAFSLGVLAFFKYFNFFSQNFLTLLQVIGIHAEYSIINIILPVGISFYTFQTMSYTIDVYRGGEPERSLLKFSTFVAFFPQLVAGPIVRASDFLPQLGVDHKLTENNVVSGLRMILWGYFLKVVIADSLSLVVDERFAAPGAHNGLSMFIGVLFYSFQIYGDFAGYSLIAIGIAKILGFNFPINFNRPYFSKNFSEFWRRWHISLSTWLRDYLYIALGGNRHGSMKTYRNLMITMLLGGLWHGSSWNFIVWGGLHGGYLVLQNIYHYFTSMIQLPSYVCKSAIIGRCYNFIAILFCFTLVSFAWIFFRSVDFSDSMLIIDKILDFDSYDFSGVSQKFHVVKGFFLIALLVFFERISFLIDIDDVVERRPYLTLVFCSLIVLMIAAFGTFDNASFIYFQF